MPALRSFGKLAVLLAVLLGTSTSARADDDSARLAKLAATLTTSPSAKARLSAAVTLGELRDPRSVRPLIRALRDKIPAVRAVAATSLGLLGHPRALSALQHASHDPDRTVRSSAIKAIAQIASSQRRAQREQRQRHRRAPAVSRPASYRIPAREHPRLRARTPDVYVVVKSASDDSKPHARRRTRRAREDKMKSIMASTLRAAPEVTINPDEAKALKLHPYYIDLTILDFKRSRSRDFVEIECAVRVAVSDRRGKMLSVMTKGAKVKVPTSTFRKQYENSLRLEALEGAVTGIHRDVVAYLQQDPS